MTTVYWGQFTFETAKWRFYLAATEEGLCYIGSPNADFQELNTWIMKKIKPESSVENQDKLDPYIAGINDYLTGQTETFSLPLQRFGTSFQQAVWRASEHIPCGQIRIYSELAHPL